KRMANAPAHIFLRYSLQKGFVPLMKSVKEPTCISNADIFAFELPLGSSR
ncbi:hypothetical protein EDB89DRAFT_1853244, partial [Lactarius sanguifluus]